MKKPLSTSSAVSCGLMVSVMLLFFSAGLHAAGYSGGSGTQNDPYLIADKNDFLTLCERTNDYNRCFALIDDIDLSGEVFSRAPIASDTAPDSVYDGVSFSGVFDGYGHVISNLQIYVADQGCFIGLFGRLEGSGCRVTRLGVAGMTVTGNTTPNRYVGAVCGENSGAYITECAVSDVSVNGVSYTGGFCGSNIGGVIADSFVTGDVEGVDKIAGFCAKNTTAGIISNCYAVCAVTGNPRNSISSFCRENTDSFISGCFWNSDICMFPSVSEVQGKTTAEMQTQSTFTDAGWNFTTLWRMNGYPAPRIYSGPQGLPFDHWIVLEGAPSEMRSESDIPSGDGIPNLLKYATGLKAMQSYTADALYSKAAVSNGEFVVRYNKASSVRDVFMEPVYSDTLDGLWSVQGLDRELFYAGEELETWQASVPLMNQGFVRLRAVRLKPVQDINPPDFGSIPFDDQITLEWTNEPFELADVSYELYFGSAPGELVQTACFENVTALTDVTASIALTEPGNYFWRVDMVFSNDNVNSLYQGELQHVVTLEALSPHLEVNTDNLVYFRWFDSSASQENSLKLDLLQGVTADIGPFNIVSNGIGEITASVIDGALPAGMSLVLTNSQLSVSGAPGQIGSGNLTIQLEKPGFGVLGSLLHIEYDVEPLPAKLIGTYQGFAWQDVEYNCDSNEFCQSTSYPFPATVVIDEDGGIYGTVEFSHTNYTFEADGFDSYYYEESVFQREIEIAVSEDEILIYKVSVDWSACGENDYNMGTPELSLHVEHWYMVFDDDLNDWFFELFISDGAGFCDIWDTDPPVADSRDVEILDRLQGYYTLSLEADDFFSGNYDSWGYGYLTVSVDSNASVNISGRLGDGEIISSSSPLRVNAVCDDTLAFAEFKMTPVSYDGGVVYMQLHFVEINGSIFIEVRNSLWVNMYPLANGFYDEGFKRNFDGISGGRYDSSLDLHELFPGRDGFSIRYPAYETNLVEVLITQDGLSFDTGSHSNIVLQADLETGVITLDHDGDTGHGVLTPWLCSLPEKEDAAARAYTVSVADNFAIYEDDPVYQYEKSSAWLLIFTE
ncbi:MAG: hypothetical protein R6V06_03690 [Kiritimatiellia bacterium]